MRALILASVVLAGVSGAAWADKPQARPARAASNPANPNPTNLAASNPTNLVSASVPAAKSGAAARHKAQQDAMKALSFLDGEWRGTAKTLRKAGWTPLPQTARSGAMLDGTMRILEVRGQEADGSPGFEALRVITFDPAKKTYLMRSHQGNSVREYEAEAKPGMLSWSTETRDGMSVRYEISVRNGVWTETATRLPAKGEPETYLSVSMKRARAGVW